MREELLRRRQPGHSCRFGSNYRVVRCTSSAIPTKPCLPGSLLVVGVLKNEAPGPDYADVATVALLHITKIETLQTAGSPG